MTDTTFPVLTVDGCDELFGSPGVSETDHGCDRFNHTQDAIRWFFGTPLGREVLASLTWRRFADDREASNLEPVGPVLQVAGNGAYKLTFIMPLRWPRRGDEGTLFLLLRGCRVAPGQSSSGQRSEEQDDANVEWAIIGRDPAKPLSCNTAVLRQARRVIEQQRHNIPGWPSIGD